MASAGLRCGLAGLLAAAATAGEVVPAFLSVTADQSQFSLFAPGEGWLIGNAAAPAQIRYEQILLSAHDLRADRQFRTRDGGEPALVPIRGSGVGGFGREMVLDSLATLLPEISARVRMTPLAMRFRLVGEAGGGLLHYRMVLDEVGAFSGDVREMEAEAGDGEVWRGYSGWARTAEIDIGAQPTASGLRFHLRRIVLRGDGQPIAPHHWWPPYPDLATVAVVAPAPSIIRRLAEMIRYEDVIGGTMGDDLAALRVAGRVNADWIVLDFPGDARSVQGKAGGMFSASGNPFAEIRRLVRRP